MGKSTAGRPLMNGGEGKDGWMNERMDSGREGGRRERGRKEGGREERGRERGREEGRETERGKRDRRNGRFPTVVSGARYVFPSKSSRRFSSGRRPTPQSYRSRPSPPASASITPAAVALAESESAGGAGSAGSGSAAASGSGSAGCALARRLKAACTCGRVGRFHSLPLILPLSRSHSFSLSSILFPRALPFPHLSLRHAARAHIF
jgi:hypothetical protein